MSIRHEPEVAPIFDPKRAQERPKQKKSGDQESAMEKFLEVISREKGKDVMAGQQLRRPKQNRREEGADEQNCGEVGEQSRCVFQECYVRCERDAQSTYMDGKG